MRKIVLLALPLILLAGRAAAGPGCGDPRAQDCNPGYWVDISGDQVACHACTGNTIANGCTRSCNACGTGSMSNAAHTACISIPLCPFTLKGSQIPSNNWSATSTRSGYYPPDSAVINDGNGQVVTGGASYSAVKSAMGSAAFSSANFAVVGGAGSASNLPANVIQCPYDGPRFHKGGQTLQATVTINCTGTCAGL